MRKFDACVGREARINKLLLKKPPGIMSAGNASSVCEQCANVPSTASEKGGKTKTAKKYERWTEEGDKL